MEALVAWQLQEAKARFSELVQKAIDEGPQTVTRRGQPAVVVLSAEQFELMKKRQISLKELLAMVSLEELDLARNQDLPRETNL
jgi:prevent-host-death family protein